MNIEDLRGKQFIHFENEGLIYTVGESEEGICTIHWDKDTVTYRDSEVVDYIKKGTWIVINDTVTIPKKIFIIEQVSCRGEQEINKYSFDSEMFFKLLDLFKVDSIDEDGEINEDLTAKIREISGKDNSELEQLLYNLLFAGEEFCETDTTLQERITAIKSGKYCVELEELIIAVGFSKKEAKANLIEIEDEDEW